MKRRTLLLAALPATGTLLSACSSGGNRGNPVPRTWIANTYERSGSYYLGSGTPTTIANEIAANTRPVARRTSSGMVFLRYREHIVRVGNNATRRNSSEIEIETYRRGHQRWYTHVGSSWPSPGRSGDGYRGGGPGSGK